jgi:hypothetical protein
MLLTYASGCRTGPFSIRLADPVLFANDLVTNITKIRHTFWEYEDITDTPPVVYIARMSARPRWKRKRHSYFLEKLLTLDAVLTWDWAKHRL